MSLSLHHVKHCRMIQHPEFTTIQEAQDYCENSRAGATTNFYSEHGGTGFTYQASDGRYVSIFAVDDSGAIWEIQLFHQWPV